MRDFDGRWAAAWSGIGSDRFGAVVPLWLHRPDGQRFWWGGCLEGSGQRFLLLTNAQVRAGAKPQLVGSLLVPGVGDGRFRFWLVDDDRFAGEWALCHDPQATGRWRGERIM